MRGDRGFTLVEVLIAMGLAAVVMTLLWSTFATSSATVQIVEERAEELSSLTGALDTLGVEIRGAYGAFTGTKTTLAFTAMTPFQREATPAVQRVSYEFDQGRFARKLDQRTFLLLDGVEEPSFTFHNGRVWVTEWRDSDRLPAGVKVAFTYRGKAVDTVIPVWSGK